MKSSVVARYVADIHAAGFEWLSVLTSFAGSLLADAVAHYQKSKTHGREICLREALRDSSDDSLELLSAAA
jgi:hypothetical protein